MALNEKYQLEPLREWFLKESPKDAVLDFKEKVETLLDSPDSFLEHIMEDDFLEAMNSDMKKIDRSIEEVNRISDFITHNADEDEGLTPFEYLLSSKDIIGKESVDFIRSQYMFFVDMNAITSSVRYNNPEGEYEAYKSQLKELLKETCGKKGELCGYLESYATFMSELMNVEEANEKYAAIAEMDSNQYEKFLEEGKDLLDMMAESREDEGAF